MKKFILFAAILFSAVTVVNAQVDAPKTGTAILTVNLKAVQSIVVSGDIVIDYASADDYLNGASSIKQVGHLSVVSAGGFAIRVEAADLTNGSNTIGAETIAVTATEGANGAGATYLPVTLEKAATALITSTKGGVNKKYDVTYKGADANKYMENFNADSKQEYTTTVTYTISAS